MDLDTWIKNNEMTAAGFARLVGVAVMVIWKARHGRPVSEETAFKIKVLTGGQVNVISKSVGRPRKKKEIEIEDRPEPKILSDKQLQDDYVESDIDLSHFYKRS